MTYVNLGLGLVVKEEPSELSCVHIMFLHTSSTVSTVNSIRDKKWYQILHTKQQMTSTMSPYSNQNIRDKELVSNFAYKAALILIRGTKSWYSI